MWVMLAVVAVVMLAVAGVLVRVGVHDGWGRQPGPIVDVFELARCGEAGETASSES